MDKLCHVLAEWLIVFPQVFVLKKAICIQHVCVCKLEICDIVFNVLGQGDDFSPLPMDFVGQSKCSSAQCFFVSC